MYVLKDIKTLNGILNILSANMVSFFKVLQSIKK